MAEANHKMTLVKGVVQGPGMFGQALVTYLAIIDDGLFSPKCDSSFPNYTAHR